MKFLLNSIYCCDCIELLSELPQDSINLLFADIPYESLDFSWLPYAFRALSPTGSLYVMTDFRTVANWKLELDKYGIFQNWIIWAYRTGGVSKKKFARKHDDILFYTKSNYFTFHPQKERIYYNSDFFTCKQDANGKWYADVYLRDVWEDIKPILNLSRERVMSKEQKPIALLERIIKCSSNIEDLVVDPFVGSGTTMIAATRLNRKYLGCDIDPTCIELALKRLCKESKL